MKSRSSVKRDRSSHSERRCKGRALPPCMRRTTASQRAHSKAQEHGPAYTATDPDDAGSLQYAAGKSTCSAAGRPPSPLLNELLRGTSVTPRPSPGRDDEAADETLPAPQPRKPSGSSAAASIPGEAAGRLAGKSTSLLAVSALYTEVSDTGVRSLAE